MSKALKGGGTLALTYVLAKMYGAHGSGLFFIAYTFVSLVSLFTELGLGNSCLKYAPVLNKKGTSGLSFMWTTFQVVAAAASMAVIAGLALAPEFFSQMVFKDPDHARFILAASPIILFWSLARINITLRQSLGDMSGITTVENFLVPLGMLVLAAAAFVLDLSVFQYIVSVSVLYGLVLAYSLVGTKKAHGLKFTLKPDSALGLKEMLVFAVPLLVIVISQTSLVKINTLVLGGIGSVNDSGVYVAAMNVVGSVSIFLYTFNKVFAPQISAAHAARDMDALRSLYREAVSRLAFFPFVVLAAIAVYAVEIMTLFGPGYESGAACLLFLVLAQMANCYTGPVGYLLILGGKSRLEIFNTVSGVVLNLALCVSLYHYLGLAGAGLAYAVACAAVNLMRYFQCRRIFGIHWLDRTTGMIVLAQVIAVSAYLVAAGSEMNREITTAILLAAYLGSFFVYVKKTLKSGTRIRK